MIHILHLSDLHFGNAQTAKNWYSQLADDLRNELNCEKIDLLIISGDVTNRASPKEYALAANFLELLSKEFHISRSSIVIVPRNHDVNWSLAKKAYSIKRIEDYKGPMGENGKPDLNYTIPKSEFIEVQNPEKYKARFNHFSEFYEKVTGYPYSPVYKEQGMLYKFPEKRILLLGLNSAWQIDHHYRSRASINSDAISEVLDQIRNSADLRKYRKIAVWHHPLNSSDEDRITDIGFLQRLAQAGFELALHGHIHKADNNVYKYDMGVDGRKISIISAGTFGALTKEWVPGYPLQYNFLKLHENLLIVETRCRREINGAWKPDAIWLQNANKDPLPRYEIPLSNISELTVPLDEDKPEGLLVVPTETFEENEKKPDDIPTKKVLILAVSPISTQRLRIDEEVREICNILWKAKKVKFIIEVRWAVRPRDLSRALLQFEPDIVHFCGHGSQEGGIILEDDKGNPHSVTPEALAGLFELFTGSIEGYLECVFLNICFTEKQANAITPYASYIIGSQGAISDTDAITFSSSFFEALANGRTIDFAYNFACKTLKVTGAFTDFIPTMRKFERVRKENGSKGIKKNNATYKILFLASSPKDTSGIRLDVEMREIYDVVNYAIQEGSISLQQRWGARFDDFHQALLDYSPQLIHFSGHGSADYLVFDDKEGRSDRINAEKLVQLLGLFSDTVECILINSFNSDEIAKQVAKIIPFAIGFRGNLSDEIATKFSVAFYRSFCSRKSIETAYKSGRLAILSMDRTDDGDYILAKRSEENP